MLHCQQDSVTVHHVCGTYHMTSTIYDVVPVPMVFMLKGRCAASGTGLEVRWPGLGAASPGASG